MIASGYSALVFDLDGTLADTAADIQQALARALEAEGLPPIDVAATRLMIGGGPVLLVKRALNRLGVEPGAGMIERLAASFHAEYLQQENQLSALFEGVKQSLHDLHASGIRLGLCSNKPDDLCRLLVANFNISEYFDEILGSGAGLPKKPDPAPLLRIIQRLGVGTDDVLYIGDSETDVITARNAGVPVALVSYGYTARPASQLGADAVYDSISDLMRPSIARSA